MVMRKKGSAIAKVTQRMKDAENEPTKKSSFRRGPGGIGSATTKVTRMMQDAKNEAAKKRPVRGVGYSLVKKMKDAQNKPQALKDGGSVKKRSKSSCK